MGFPPKTPNRKNIWLNSTNVRTFVLAAQQKTHRGFGSSGRGWGEAPGIEGKVGGNPGVNPGVNPGEPTVEGARDQTGESRSGEFGGNGSLFEPDLGIHGPQIGEGDQGGEVLREAIQAREERRGTHVHGQKLPGRLLEKTPVI